MRKDHKFYLGFGIATLGLFALIISIQNFGVAKNDIVAAIARYKAGHAFSYFAPTDRKNTKGYFNQVDATSQIPSETESSIPNDTSTPDAFSTTGDSSAPDTASMPSLTTSPTPSLSAALTSNQKTNPGSSHSQKPSATPTFTPTAQPEEPTQTIMPSTSPSNTPTTSASPKLSASASPSPSANSSPRPSTSASPSPSVSPMPSASPIPSASPTPTAWGAYVGDSITDAADFESQVGKRINLQAIFIGFGDPFPSEFGSTVRDNGKTLVIFWEPYNTSLDNINNGSSDSYIKQFAAAAKTYAGPVILAPLHEMNGDWDPWDGTVGTNTPAKVITAWKRIHDLFAAATNVKFGWAVNNTSEPNVSGNQIETYYPGDAYVDIVGVDGFNFANPWQTFSQVFDNALARLAVYNKPIYIFSMACADGSQKAAWITDALKTQIPKHPLLAGWIWFNQNKERNWLVWSDSASLSAFKASLP